MKVTPLHAADAAWSDPAVARLISNDPKAGAEPPPDHTDEALALAFAERHAGDLRYVASWGRWLIWDGQRWKFDETLRAFDLSRAICREAAAKCKKSKLAAVLASAKTVAAVERLAKADRRLAATQDQWDADPWFLNTPGGVVDLRTGDMRPPCRDDHMTKITAVAPGGECPTWLKFLDRIFGTDRELIAFVQLMLGYALTGSTREHALFFCYGTGANGKGTLLNTVAAIIGDYATTAPMETFIATTSERHPTDMAGLRGARLVTAQETEEGRRWAEAKIKALTGGDKIAARFMRQDFFEFTPQFKLIIAGNHRPALRNVDEAIRRRLHLIPFTVTIPPDERDGTLPERLRAEWPGILAWMIRGAVAWASAGLRPPQVVRDATDKYLAAEDALERWLEERCDLDPQCTATSSDLYADWKRWCEETGEFSGSLKRFIQNLESRNLRLQRWQHPISRKPGFRGLFIRPIGHQPAEARNE